MPKTSILISCNYSCCSSSRALFVLFEFARSPVYFFKKYLTLDNRKHVQLRQASGGRHKKMERGEGEGPSSKGSYGGEGKGVG